MPDRKEWRAKGEELFGQVWRFTLVGGLGFIVDVVLFNVLRAQGPVDAPAWPVVAKASSTVVAIAVNWVGNRWWTFRSRRRADTVREAMEFFAASLIGGGVSLLCLVVSHDVLRLTSVVDDNLSANVVGLLLGSGVRFVAYRWWVFRAPHAPNVHVKGNRIATVAPPDGGDEMWALPPASSTSLDTIAKPSPPPA